MMRSQLILLLSVIYLVSVVAHAEGRPWGVVAPFGSGVATQKGFQGRYNPWEYQLEEEEPPAPPVQKRIRQGWQNIYQPRADEESWPDTQTRDKKGDENSRRRMFGNKSLSDEEQWPERQESPAPYRSIEQFQAPFGTFTPNMMPQPQGMPFGGSPPYWPRY
jgi:hypothetical protein